MFNSSKERTKQQNKEWLLNIYSERGRLQTAFYGECKNHRQQSKLRKHHLNCHWDTPYSVTQNQTADRIGKQCTAEKQARIKQSSPHAVERAEAEKYRQPKGMQQLTHEAELSRFQPVIPDAAER